MSPKNKRSAVNPSQWETLDSGNHETYTSGMKRDTQEGKPRFDLILPKSLPYQFTMLTRWASLMERGAQKYGDRNWEKGNGFKELERAEASAFRHMVQWLNGETDEGHAAAVFFNSAAAEYFKYQISEAEEHKIKSVS